MKVRLSNASLRFFLSIVGIAICIFRPDLVLAENIPAKSKAEIWVLKQLMAGQEANLADPSARLTNEKHRVLSAAFLEKLLTTSPQSARIHRHGVNIRHAVFQEDIDLRNAKVSYPTALRSCRFERKVDLSYSVFEKDLDFSESTFAANQFLDAPSFVSLHVGGNAFFNDAQFFGWVNFMMSNVGGTFYASHVRFTDTESYGVFIGMKVGGHVYIDQAEFAGGVNFTLANIAGVFSANHIRFTNPDSEASFGMMKVGGHTIFSHAEFAGPVDFSLANIGGELAANHIRFTNPEQTANFSSMKVGGQAYFNDVECAGGIVFTLADISGQFTASRSHFTNTQAEVMFNGLRVGGIAYFQDAEFGGRVNFGLADIAGLFVARGARFSNGQEKVTFSAMKVGSHAIFDRVKFSGPTDFTHMRVGGHASFDETEIAKTINFEFAEIASDFWMERAHLTDPDVTGQFNGMKIGGAVHFKETEFRGAVDLGNMTYRAITVSDGKDQIENLIALVNRSRFSAAVYSNLEAFFKRQGETAFADEVFIAQKTRERHVALHWYMPEYWWNWVSYLFIGYGRKPSYVLAWSALFVILASFIFKQPERMEVQKEEYSEEIYSPFWYSLGLFLPVVNLFAAEVWRPKKDFRWGRTYMRVHSLLGWILIPLGLAAITGLIK